MTSHHAQRKQIRLETHNYSSVGAYFVTICTQLRGYEWFGQVTNKGMQPNQAGETILETWQQLTNQFDISLDAFVVMPDHVHGIIVLNENVVDVVEQDTVRNPVGAGLVPARVTNHDMGMNVTVLNDMNVFGLNDSALHRATTRVAPTQDGKMNPVLGDVIGAFKSITTNQYIRGVREDNWMPFEKRFWQRNFYDRIVRNDADLERCRDYIEGNPARWLEKTKGVEK